MIQDNKIWGTENQGCKIVSVLCLVRNYMYACWYVKPVEETWNPANESLGIPLSSRTALKLSVSTVSQFPLLVSIIYWWHNLPLTLPAWVQKLIIVMWYVTLHEKTRHNALEAIIWDTGQFSCPMCYRQLYGLIEESFLNFLYIKICLVASRILYLPIYGSKKSAM